MADGYTGSKLSKQDLESIVQDLNNISKAVDDIIEAFVTVIKALKDGAVGALIEILADVADKVYNAFKTIVTAVVDLAKSIWDFVTHMFDNDREMAGKLGR